jgi:hypothetical protein
VAFDYHVAEIDPDAEPNAPLFRHLGSRSAIPRWISAAQRTASTTLGNSAKKPSPVIEFAYMRDWRALVAPGGHGKTQFAVQAQYLIGQFPSTELVIYAGAAGSRGRDRDSRA